MNDIEKSVKKHNMVLEIFKEFLIAFLIVIIITLFLKPMIIKQSSMEPNFYENEYIIVSRQAYTLFGEEERGDIVIFKSNLVDSNGNNKKLIKRIIGLPGETIEITDGYVYINGELLKEPYVKEAGTSGEMEKITLGDDEYFLMGDNREVSMDSRSSEIGTVKESDIYGRVIIRLFPLNRISTFKRITY